MAIPSTAGDFSEFDTKSGYKRMFDTVEEMHPTGEENNLAKNFGRCIQFFLYNIEFYPYFIQQCYLIRVIL